MNALASGGFVPFMNTPTTTLFHEDSAERTVSVAGYAAREDQQPRCCHYLGLNEPFLYKLVAVLAREMGDALSGTAKRDRKRGLR